MLLLLGSEVYSLFEGCRALWVKAVFYLGNCPKRTTTFREIKDTREDEVPVNSEELHRYPKP